MLSSDGGSTYSRFDINGLTSTELTVIIFTFCETPSDTLLNEFQQFLVYAVTVMQTKGGRRNMPLFRLSSFLLLSAYTSLIFHDGENFISFDESEKPGKRARTLVKARVYAKIDRKHLQSGETFKNYSNTFRNTYSELAACNV